MRDRLWVKFQEVPGWVLSTNPGNIFKLSDAPNVPFLRGAFRVTTNGLPAMTPEEFDKCLATVYIKRTLQTLKLVYVKTPARFEVRLIDCNNEIESYRWYETFDVAMEMFMQALPVKNVGNPMNHIKERPKTEYEEREGFGQWA